MARVGFDTSVLPPAAQVLRCFLFFSGEREPFFVPGWMLQHEFFYGALGAALLLRRPATRLAALTVRFGALIASRGVLGGISVELARYGSPLLLEFLAGSYIAVATKPCSSIACVRLPGRRLLRKAVVAGVVRTPKLFAPDCARFLLRAGGASGAGAVLVEDTLRGRRHTQRRPSLVESVRFSITSRAARSARVSKLVVMRPYLSSLSSSPFPALTLSVRERYEQSL